MPPSRVTSRARGWDGATRLAASNLLLAPRSLVATRTWLASADVVVSLVVGALFALLTACALLVVVATSWVVGLGVLSRGATLWLAAQMARLDRWRVERLGDRHIEPPALPEPEPGAPLRVRQLAWGRASWLWPLPVYQLARLPLAAAAAFVALGWWWATIACFVLASQPAGPILVVGWDVGPLSLGAGEMAGLVVAGLVGLLAWPGVARGTMGLDAALAARQLGPSHSGQLAAEVSRLSQARTLAVVSAEAERRRIERDLHDGLQPQLVSLALDLGLALSRIDKDPDAARSMVERAHEEAKRAAADLRNLVRGIHPSVLDERGIDAALSALVASCPVPVTIEVNLSRRPEASVEGVAYFVVAEAITNITRHSGAHTASVRMDEDDETLRVVVEDDGRGGARLDPGGGLAGLAARVASVDGTFRLSSPTGGPTRVEAVIPCVR